MKNSLSASKSIRFPLFCMQSWIRSKLRGSARATRYGSDGLNLGLNLMSAPRSWKTMPRTARPGRIRSQRSWKGFRLRRIYVTSTGCTGSPNLRASDQVLRQHPYRLPIGRRAAVGGAIAPTSRGCVSPRRLESLNTSSRRCDSPGRGESRHRFVPLRNG